MKFRDRDVLGKDTSLDTKIGADHPRTLRNKDRWVRQSVEEISETLQGQYEKKQKRARQAQRTLRKRASTSKYLAKHPLEKQRLDLVGEQNIEAIKRSRKALDIVFDENQPRYEAIRIEWRRHYEITIARLENFARSNRLETTRITGIFEDCRTMFETADQLMQRKMDEEGHFFCPHACRALTEEFPVAQWEQEIVELANYPIYTVVRTAHLRVPKLPAKAFPLAPEDGQFDFNEGCPTTHPYSTTWDPRKSPVPPVRAEPNVLECDYETRDLALEAAQLEIRTLLSEVQGLDPAMAGTIEKLLHETDGGLVPEEKSRPWTYKPRKLQNVSASKSTSVEARELGDLVEGLLKNHRPQALQLALDLMLGGFNPADLFGQTIEGQAQAEFVMTNDLGQKMQFSNFNLDDRTAKNELEMENIEMPPGLRYDPLPVIDDIVTQILADGMFTPVHEAFTKYTANLKGADRQEWRTDFQQKLSDVGYVFDYDHGEYLEYENLLAFLKANMEISFSDEYHKERLFIFSLTKIFEARFPYTSKYGPYIHDNVANPPYQYRYTP